MAFDETLKANMADPWWRICNLYSVVTDEAKEMAFVPNDEQRDLFNRLHNANLILKARQLGFCVSPDTPILTAKLQWVKVADLSPGDRIVGVDENTPTQGSIRRMREATVVGSISMVAERYRITFDDGRTIICTGHHPWLSRRAGACESRWLTITGKPGRGGSRWANQATELLRVGDSVRWITKPWGEPDFEDGWFSGILDGEGSINLKGGSTTLNASQRPGAVWGRMLAYAKSRGYNFTVEDDSSSRLSKFGKTPVPKLNFGRGDEIMRLIGQTRPSRFIGSDWWQGRAMPGKKSGAGWSEIVSIEPIGRGEVVDLQTTSKTYIANGFVSHNTTFIDILGVDQVVFNENYTAGIIAHSLNDSAKIFRNKVKKVYDNLPTLVQNMAPIVTSSASELVLANGSSISVGTSSRGGTLQFLHVSEMGKIARKYPEKANEIVSGAFESVPIGGLKFVESTAEGRAGWFFEAVIESRKRMQAGKKDTPLDFRLHFVPWFTKASYAMNPEGSFLSDTDRRYFAELKSKHGVSTTLAQQIWYVKKKAVLGELMLREYPSTIDEAFQASVEGMILAEEMKHLRLLGRIGKSPIIPGLPVNTMWDFGVNDHNSIWLHQRVGSMNRFVRYFQDQNKGMRHYWTLLEGHRMQHGYKWGNHYLPHDAEQRMQGVEVFTKKDALVEVGMRADSIKVVQRTPDKTTAVNQIKRMLPECEFDEEECDEGLDCLDNYSREWDEHMGDWKRLPRHDKFSHGADAFQTFAQSWASGAQQEVSGVMAGVGFVQPAGYGRGGY